MVTDIELGRFMRGMNRQRRKLGTGLSSSSARNRTDVRDPLQAIEFVNFRSRLT
jgi:hypothetical protein